MTIGEFFKKSFGIDTTAELVETAPRDSPANLPNTDTPTVPENSIIEPSADVNTTNSLATENARLTAEVARLKQDNAKLAAGKSIDSPTGNNLEEILHTLYGGIKNGSKTVLSGNSADG